MINYQIPKKNNIDDIRNAFNDLSWEEILKSSNDTKLKSSSLSLSEIYNYIRTAPAPDEKIEKIIRSNINLWKFYKKIISETAIIHIPEAMAASSEELPFTRHGKDWTLTIELSRAEPQQVYIIFKLLININPAPTSIFFFKGDQTPPRWELPEVHDGVIQFIANRESHLVKLLMDPQTEAYLR